MSKISNITAFLIFAALLKELFYRIGVSVPTTELFAAESNDTTHEIESHWSGLTEADQIFWKVSFPIFLFFVLTSLVFLQLLLLWASNLQDSERETTEHMKVVLALCDCFSLEPINVDKQNERYTEFHNEIESLKELKEAIKRRNYLFKETNCFFKFVNNEYKPSPHLRKQMDIIANIVKMQGKDRTEISKTFSSIIRPRKSGFWLYRKFQ
jgi:hypothetical protein